jgi:hypothetical protein
LSQCSQPLGTAITEYGSRTLQEYPCTHIDPGGRAYRLC